MLVARITLNIIPFRVFAMIPAVVPLSEAFLEITSPSLFRTMCDSACISSTVSWPLQLHFHFWKQEKTQQDASMWHHSHGVISQKLLNLEGSKGHFRSGEAMSCSAIYRSLFSHIFSQTSQDLKTENQQEQNPVNNFLIIEKKKKINMDLMFFLTCFTFFS